MNTAGRELYRIRTLRRASRCSDATITQIALDIRRAREALETTKPKRGRKERDYLGDFNACFPDFAPAETYEKLFFRIAIVSGLLGSDAKAYEYVAARHPTGKSASGAPILPNHLADARKNNLRAERTKAAAARAERRRGATVEPAGFVAREGVSGDGTSRPPLFTSEASRSTSCPPSAPMAQI